MHFQGSFRRIRAAGILALTLSAVAAPSLAALPRWERATPFGGYMVSLEQAPSAPWTLYALSSYPGVLFRSLDGGATWNRRNGGIEDDYIAALVVDPHDAATVYARGGAYRNFFRSRDGGLTWTQITSDNSFSALAADRDHPGVLFAGRFDGLYRSADRGDSWVRVAFEDLAVSGVAFDPRAAGTIFVLTETVSEPALVWKSIDRGTTWTSSEISASSSSGRPLFVFDPVRPEVLYLSFITGYDVSYSGVVLRSGDGGASWTELYMSGIRDLVAAPDGTLLAATDYGLERSGDGGATWAPPIEGPYSLPPGGPPFDFLSRILASPATPGQLFAAGGSGVWKSGDNGATWALANRGVFAHGAWEVAVSPGSAVFALTGDELFRSADRGATWTRIHSRLEGPQPEGIKPRPYSIEAFDLRHPGTIYGIDSDGQAAYPVVSTDGGREWAELEIPYTCGGDSICDVSLTTVALGRDGSIFAGGSYYFHYQGGGSYLVRSRDGGQSWQDLAPIAGIGDLEIDPKRRDTYLAVSCEGFFRSTDAGASWKETGRGLPSRLCLRDGRVPVLKVDPRDSRRLYIGTLNRGVYASSDGGMTFRAMNRGLETAAIGELLIDPTDSSKLYVGIAEKGVFGWDAGQRKWTPLNRQLPLAYFGGAIALDPRHPSTLYAASPAEGVFRLELDEAAP